ETGYYLAGKMVSKLEGRLVTLCHSGSRGPFWPKHVVTNMFMPQDSAFRHLFCEKCGLEAALRANKRQAAPHSRGETKADPQRPGRKPGREYGQHACRPAPSHIDEQIEVPLPEQCPH